MTYENIIIPVLTFLLGVLVGLLYKYADIIELKNNIKTLQATQAGVVAMVGDVRSIRESLIFKPDFIQQLSVVCFEHKDMHDQIDKNTGKLHVLETLLDIKTK